MVSDAGATATRRNLRAHEAFLTDSWISLSSVSTSSLFLRGPTLKEMSEILISRGVQFAVNMDGGGSSVMVGRDQHDDIKILSRPTCWDVDVQCERPVATVFCMN